MRGNSTTPVMAYEVAAEPISIVGLVLGIIGLMQSGLFTYTAITGLGKPPGVPQAPKEWGKPWPFSIATGMEGMSFNPNPNESTRDPLQDPGGPFPDIHLL